MFVLSRVLVSLSASIAGVTNLVCPERLSAPSCRTSTKFCARRLLVVESYETIDAGDCESSTGHHVPRGSPRQMALLRPMPSPILRLSFHQGPLARSSVQWHKTAKVYLLTNRGSCSKSKPLKRKLSFGR